MLYVEVLGLSTRPSIIMKMGACNCSNPFFSNRNIYVLKDAFVEYYCCGSPFPSQGSINCSFYVYETVGSTISAFKSLLLSSDTVKVQCHCGGASVLRRTCSAILKTLSVVVFSILPFFCNVSRLHLYPSMSMDFSVQPSPRPRYKCA